MWQRFPGGEGNNFGIRAVRGERKLELLRPTRCRRNHKECGRLPSGTALLKHANQYGGIEPRKHAQLGVGSSLGNRLLIEVCRFEGAQNSVNRHLKSLRGTTDNVIP